MSTAAAWNNWDTVAGERETALLELASLQCPIVVEIAVSPRLSERSTAVCRTVFRTRPNGPNAAIAWGEAAERAARQQAKASGSGRD